MILKRIDFFSLFCLCALIDFIIWNLSWIFYVDNIGNPKDWILFWDTSNLFASGQIDKIYPGVTPNLPFMYPPYFLFFIYPLSYFSKPEAYLFIITLNCILLFCSLWILASIFKIDSRSYIKICVLILSSASWVIMLPLGNLGVLYLFIICLSLRLLLLNLKWQSGIVLAFLMLKPNIGIIFPFLFLLRSEYKLVTGWLVSMVMLFLLPAIFFKNIWDNYFSLSATIPDILFQIPPWKHHTLHALLRSFFITKSGDFILMIWLIPAFILTVLCSFAWYVTEKDNNCYPRLYGIAVLSIIVCSPYLHHYDAIIAALFFIAWFSNKGNYYFKFSYSLIGGFLFLAYFIQQISVLHIQAGYSLVSIPLMFCLIIDILDIVWSRVELR